jgi:phosphonate ABC transporter substrate-binding protein
MRKTTSIAMATVLVALAAAAAAPAPVTLVICAPGYPSNTAEAQPSMDALAKAVTQAAGWPDTRLAAEYHETEQGGVARFKGTPPTLALVPLPFYLSHASDLKLVPRTQAVMKGGGATESWTLVAKKGRVTTPSSLAGWQLVSLAAYSPRFVRNVALASWGAIPKDVTFVPSGSALSALRKAAAGDNVAVLLDGSQAASLPTLPFAADLEVVATSPALPAVVLCTVGSGIAAPDLKSLVAGLIAMDRTPEGFAALDAVRIAKFIPLDDTGLAASRAAYGSAGARAAK